MAPEHHIPQHRKNFQVIAWLILVLAALAALSGYLMSQASLVGKTGINFFYREYRFLKIWWQGAAVVFGVLLLLMFLQAMVNQKWPGVIARVVHICMIILAAAGLYFTYLDFTNTVSHRLLGEKFHLGAYLFWIAWKIIGIYFLWRTTQHKTVDAS